ncbi:glycosyltransferase family 61 protein [Marilutibacter alkalisoli]|nr:glycosyltransferase 61 family protein [Lysobacter alkalisoli]
MLSPLQTIDLRRRITEEGRVDRGYGFALAHSVNPPVDWGEVVVSEPSLQVEFQTPEFVLGDPEDPSCLADVLDPKVLKIPTKAVRAFRGVRIVGWRSMFTRDGFYSSASEFRDAGGNPDALVDSRWDGLVVHDGVLTYVAGHKDRIEIKGNTLFLPALEPANYGSFVIRVLPKLLYFVEQGIRIDQIVVPQRILATAEAMAMTGLGALPVYSVPEASALEFERLYVIDDFELKGCMCSGTMSRLRSLPGVHSNLKRIYVSRRLNAHRPLRRPLLNEAKIEREAEKMGFQAVFPESLSFRQQIGLFAGADFIVGPSGSGMLNSLFSAPGAKVLDIESFHSTVRQHARIYSSGGHRYAFAFGKFDPSDKREPPHLRRWTASPGMIVEGIEKLQAG